jgi:RNA polymerase sigma-70 factor (ECF subfamily)
MTSETNIAASSPIEDASLVRSVIDGDLRLFERLMRKHNSRLFRISRAILRDDAEAEDAMQEAYIQAFAHLHTLEEPRAFGAWVARIVVREANARMKRRRKAEDVAAADEEVDHMDSEASGPFDPERSASRVEMRAVLEEAIDSLPVPFRTVFVMRAVEEMSGAETAEALDIPEETVKTRLFRAREMLRQRLIDRADSSTADAFPFHAPKCDRVVHAVLARLNPSESKQ